MPQAVPQMGVVKNEAADNTRNELQVEAYVQVHVQITSTL